MSRLVRPGRACPRALQICSVVLAGIDLLFFAAAPHATADDVGSGGPGPATPHVAAVTESTFSAGSASAFAASDPQAFLRACLQRVETDFPAYRCRFVKNEVIDGKLSGDQVIDITYRHEPRCVYMKWVDNAGGARRLLWMKGRNLDDKGQEQLRLEPTGIASFFVSDISLPMTDKRIQAECRRPITDFGFYATLDYIVRDNAAAARAGVLDLRYEGSGAIDGRPTHIFVRHLPYAGPQSPFPDARMVMHLDQELLVPLQIWSYADREEKHLLESYHISRIEKNPGLTDNDFRF